MSTPAQGRPAAKAPAAAAAAAQQPAAAQQQPGTQQTATSRATSSSTPRILRWARGAAAAAALLTGVVATGTFSTTGVNSTPNVIAQQWVAAEEAGVEMAHADLLAAQRVSADEPALQEAYDESVQAVTEDLTRVAGTGGDPGRRAVEAATPWSSFVLGAERAAGSSSTDAYATASASALEAVAATDALADQHAEDLRTGSRSTLTAVVGSAATLLMLGLLVWLALRTRRIINVPLGIATAITAGLAYISLNPSALPVDYDQRIASASATATALQDVYEARQAQHAVSLGLDDRWSETSGQARASVQRLRDSSANGLWREVEQAGDQGAAGDLSAREAVTSSQASFDSLESDLREALSVQLGESAAAVGTPAAVTSGAALLLGLIAAALAWTGISQRLRDYR